MKSASGITRAAQTQWRGPSGSAVMTNGSVVLTSAVSGPLRTVQNVTFRLLTTSDAGVYTCQAILFSSALTVPYLTTQSYTLRITSMRNVESVCMRVQERTIYISRDLTDL